jgi:hypothetical protein
MLILEGGRSSLVVEYFMNEALGLIPSASRKVHIRKEWSKIYDLSCHPA